MKEYCKKILVGSIISAGIIIIVYLIKMSSLLIKISKALPNYLKDQLFAEDVSLNIHANLLKKMHIKINMVNTLELEEDEIRNKIIDYLIETFPLARKFDLDIDLFLDEKEEVKDTYQEDENKEEEIEPVEKEEEIDEQKEEIEKTKDKE